MSRIADQELQERLKELQPELVQALKGLIKIPSVIDEATAEADSPFGKPIAKALTQTLALSESLGFRTYQDPEGYYGYAEIGEGEELFGILGHLDVVPAGSAADWDTNPFDPVEKNGRLYGRGAQDDKGPVVAALYAVKALMDLDVLFQKRIRFIFGTDEETLWRCMEKYSEKEELPAAGFTPDSVFPLVYAEKGLLQVLLTGKNESSISLDGGTAFNAVPDEIVYYGDQQDALLNILAAKQFEYENLGDGIKVLGKAAHAQAAETGVNAINRLALALHELKNTSKTISFIAELIQEDAFATKIFGDCEDVHSGKLKFNVGKISIDKEMEKLSIDIRIPVTVEKTKIIDQLKDAARKYELHLEEFDWLSSIFLPKDHPLIETLMEVYQEVSGDYESQPLSSGGATYARAIENCVAFGAVFPDSSKTEHQPNEHVVLEELYKAMEIYAKAIYKLTI